MTNDLIKGVVIITGLGTDTLILQTNLPPATWPFDENPSMQMQVAAAKGEEYVFARL